MLHLGRHAAIVLRDLGLTTGDTPLGAGYIDSYYRRTLAHAASYPALAGDLAVDVCVIGGGLAGLSAALELARRGRKVALVERNRIAWGASGRNGGFVSPGYAVGFHTLKKKLGAAHAEALQRLSIEGVEIVRSAIGTLAITDAEIAPGLLSVARYENARDLQAYRDEMAGTFGEKIGYLPRDELCALLNTETYHQGLYFPDAFHFHPLNYAQALAREITRLGGRIFEATPATVLQDNGDRQRVITPGGAVSVAHVVLAGGGYTDGLSARLRRAFLPIATYVILTEPLGDLLPETIRTRAAIADDRRAGDYYRVVGEGRLLWGGHITTRTTDPANLAERLRRGMVATYPQLAGLKVEAAWSGLMSYARHMMPQIGKTRAGRWHCTGFGGHGMNTTAIGGRLIAEAISGETDRYRLFAPFGLDWNGGPAGRAAAQLTYWSYQARDWMREHRSG